MRKGFSVTGVDIDPVVEKDFSRAVIEIPEIKDKGEFKKVLNNTLPFPDSSVDVIYSISVLEHIPSPHKVIAEIARILKSNGVFILTMDIDLVGNLDLSPQKYSAIMSEINKYFRILGAETTVHPKGLLTTKNSKYPFVIHQSLAVKIARPIWELVKPLLGRPKAVFPTLAVCGYVLERR
jgi:ubiquinone/menaquinone biosynthesis C-methylase UbiE